MSSPDGTPRAPMGGRSARWPFAVALAGVAVVAAAIVLVSVFAGSGTTGSRQQGTGLTTGGAVACPEFFEHASTAWVPAKPAGVHSKTKMVPKLHPTHVTICRYAGRSSKSLRLSGQRVLHGTSDGVVGTLRALRPLPKGSYGCLMPDDNYLIGIRYAEAIVWVSTSGCLASNGTFTALDTVSPTVAASYRARTWTPS